MFTKFLVKLIYIWLPRFYSGLDFLKFCFVFHKKKKSKLFFFSLDKDGQHEARVALALKLGAKPEKKICKPYAEYKMEVQNRKEEIQKQKELDRMTGMKKVSARPLSTKKSNAAKNSKDSNNTKKTKSKQNEKTPLKMGKFDGGTLRISQKEVAKMRK